MSLKGEEFCEERLANAMDTAECDIYYRRLDAKDRLSIELVRF